MAKISIVIPTYNESRHIRDCIESLLRQDIEDFEVIVVDNGSRDGTPEIVEEFAARLPEKVRLVVLDRNYGPGGARNVGAEVAGGEVLVFLDADMVFPPDYLRKLVEPVLKGETPSTVHCEEIVANPENPWVKVQGQLRRSGSSARVGEAFRAIRRELFLSHGGFDPSMHYHDDRTFYHKTRLRAALVRDAVCYHNNPDTAGEVFRRNYWIGRTLIAITLKEEGVRGLVRVVGAVVVRLLDLLALPLLALWAFLRIGGTSGPLLDVFLVTPAVAFFVLVGKMKILRGRTMGEDLILRCLYAPAYRVIRAAGLLAGIAVSLTTGLRRRVPTTSRPPSRAPRVP